jgi:DNA-binding MurR/RpiR family transcriptional regulator
VGQTDVAIGITIPRYTRLTVEGLKYAKSQGCTTVAITDSSVSPLAEHADIALYTGTQVESFADSFVAPLSLANALLASISVETKDTSTNRLRELEKLWRQERIYIEG